MAIQSLIHPDFYGNPVELEPVDDMHLLGFDVDLATERLMENSRSCLRWFRTPTTLRILLQSTPHPQVHLPVLGSRASARSASR